MSAFRCSGRLQMSARMGTSPGGACESFIVAVLASMWLTIPLASSPSGSPLSVNLADKTANSFRPSHELSPCKYISLIDGNRKTRVP